MGGTERNIARAFTEAREVGALLLIDEAHNLPARVADYEPRLLDELCLTLSPTMGGDALPVAVSTALSRKACPPEPLPCP